MLSGSYDNCIQNIRLAAGRCRYIRHTGPGDAAATLRARPGWRTCACVRSCRTGVRDRLFTATASHLGDLSRRDWRARDPAALGTGKACTAGGFRSRCTGSLHRAGYNGWTGLDEAAAALEHEAILRARVGRGCTPTENAARQTGRHFCFVRCGALLQQARAARPLVLGAEHRHRNFGRIGVSDDAVLVEIVGRLLDLDIAGQ